LGKYKKLKNQLIPSKRQAGDRHTTATAASDRLEAGGVQPEVIKAIEDLKLFIHQELHNLKEEIKKLREETGAGPRS
jgi:hypothetical protein